ncbi:MAG: ATP-binding cassette domain-containing protein, partial [Terrimicrobiaceae bacterium]|nr:ATP-binding cassette domain-containing protein [Terrimicrobiaceae bacterium]
MRHHNLRGLDVEIPLGVLCCITGVSGSGKSSLVEGVLHPLLAGEEGAEAGESPAVARSVRGAEAVSGVMMVDQTPLSRTPRSTPAVYTGAWDGIRQLYGLLPESLAAGFSPASFSFNSGDGRCGRCGGLGFEKVEMQFLSDLFLRCPECVGRRFRPSVLEIRWREKSVADVLEMPVDEALEFFEGEEAIVRALRPLADVGLGYLALGQPLNELSGGESQRLKLAGHLAAPRQSGSLLLFDEPPTSLHFDDIARLLGVFRRLVEAGESLVVIEHNLEVIKSADYILDLGPEAGEEGGRIVARGTPEEVAACPDSHTGRFLKEVLERPAQARMSGKPRLEAPAARGPGAIVVRGAREHNLKNISLEIPHGRMVVVTGLSGSGKSTLAFDILFAEGQRRFLDSMSAYARQFVEQMEKPEVDSVEGLPPTVAIEQRVTRGGGKSTVATITEAYHFLRLLYAKTGVQHCPDCQLPVAAQSQSSVAETVRRMARRGQVRVLAPLVRGRKGLHTKIARWAAAEGIGVLVVDGRDVAVEAFRPLDRYREHTIEAEIATASGPAAEEAVLRALEIGKGSARVVDSSGVSHVLSTSMN